MALTISYDGFGVIANADDEDVDTAGGYWAEIGAGAVSTNPDVAIYGIASFGSKYATKKGFTFFVSDNTFDFSVGGAQEGQYIYMWVNILGYSPFYDISTLPFNLIVGNNGDVDTISEWTIAGKLDSNDWVGGWKLFVFDPTKATSKTVGGGVDLTVIDVFGLRIETDVSVRSESIFISQIMIAKGLRVEGTSSNMYDDIVEWCEDYKGQNGGSALPSGARAAGMFQSRGQGYYSLGSLTIHSDTANTSVSSLGSNVEYEKSEYWNGSAWVTSYPSTANLIKIGETSGNTVTLEDVNIGIAGNSSNRVSIDSSNSTSYLKNGGYLKYLSSMISKLTDLYNGVVFSLYSARTLGVESYSTCTFDGGEKLTVPLIADFNNSNIINGVAGVTSLSTINIEYLATNTLNSSGNNHGVELTSIGSGSMNCNINFVDFDSGVTGSPITPTNTGNEAIHVTAVTGTLTISIGTGYPVPSIKSDGAIVNVVAGQVTTLITVKESITGVILEGARVYLVGVGGSLDGVVIFNTLTVVSGEVTDTRSIAVDQGVTGRVRFNTSPNFYKTVPINETISAINGLTLNVAMTKDA